MSRSGYSDDCSGAELNLYRGTVARTIRGKRGQAFLRELRDALDAMPVKVLITGELMDADGDQCALGAVAVARGLDVSGIDSEDGAAIAALFGVSETLVREIEWENDEVPDAIWTAEQRWSYMRKWVDRQIIQDARTARLRLVDDAN